MKQQERNEGSSNKNIPEWQEVSREWSHDFCAEGAEATSPCRILQSYEHSGTTRDIAGLENEWTVQFYVDFAM